MEELCSYKAQLFFVKLRQVASGTWEPLLQCLHLDKCLLERRNTENPFLGLLFQY